MEQFVHIPGFFIGLDLGQTKDYTALAIVEKLVPTPPAPEGYRTSELFQGGMPIAPTPVDLPPAFHVRHLERVALLTPYPKIIERVQEVLREPVLHGARLIVDATGVGRPVVDMFRAARLKPVPVTIVPGATEAKVDGYWHVPKINLIGGLQVLLQSERLKIAKGLPVAQTLIQELKDYQVKITAAANDTYNAREGQHDDLVLALALAVWQAQKRTRIEVGETVVSYYNPW